MLEGVKSDLSDEDESDVRWRACVVTTRWLNRLWGHRDTDVELSGIRNL